MDSRRLYFPGLVHTLISGSLGPMGGSLQHVSSGLC